MTQDTLNTHLLQSAEAVQSALDSGKTVVFSGGACNCITTEGTKVRNTARDSLNGYLAENDIFYFDPQIHPDTHGREYNYDVDGPGEQTARSLAAVTIYQIGDDTLGAVTGLEAVRDAVGGKKVVLWLSGEHDAKNKPMFVPQGVNTEGLDPATKAHLGEYVSGGQKLRQNLRDFIKGFSNVRVVRTEDEAKAALQELTQI